VRRDHIVEDAFDELFTAGDKLKGRVQVEFITDQGLSEAGIDGGGLFKEFIDLFAKAAFDPTFGLFIPTSHQLLFPNPLSLTASDASSDRGVTMRYYEFLGKMIGKALYERILMESEFAGGFLNILLGRTNSFDDLYYLDSQLYQSLVQLKKFANEGGNIDSLELYFETSYTDRNGRIFVESIVPNGSNIQVTRSNIREYIHRLANHKQNILVRNQCRSLLKGFRELIPIEWIRVFNTTDLQLLISGDLRLIDIVDMKKHVNYGSGYHESQSYIEGFWTIVSEMTPQDQRHLLKFVTSCSRQPLRGFGELNPHFCIQKIPAYTSQYTGLEPPLPGEVPRLPSAATCMNLLKLPQYDSIETLKEKLLYAIRSNSGFELS